MDNLLFISLLKKEDLLTVKQIKDYFKKDVTIRALKKGYPEDTKFKLLLKDFKFKGDTYTICFVFEDSVGEKLLQELSDDDLLKSALLKLYEDNELLIEGEI